MSAGLGRVELVDSVEGDDLTPGVPEVPSIFVTASLRGEDTRLREITVSVPCHDARPAEYLSIIRAILGEVARLGQTGRISVATPDAS